MFLPSIHPLGCSNGGRGEILPRFPLGPRLRCLDAILLRSVRAGLAGCAGFLPLPCLTILPREQEPEQVNKRPARDIQTQTGNDVDREDDQKRGKEGKRKNKRNKRARTPVEPCLGCLSCQPIDEKKRRGGLEEPPIVGS